MTALTDKLLSIEKTDLLGELGVLVLPKIPASQYRGSVGRVPVLLRKPDGVELPAVAEITMPHVNPTPAELFFLCILRDLREEDVPVGSEIRLFRESKKSA